MLKGNLAKSVPSFVDSKEIEKSLNNLLAKCSIKEEVGVGKMEQHESFKVLGMNGYVY